MYLKRDNEKRSCKHRRSGKVISMRYSECVFVALVTLYAIRMRHIVICDLSGSTIFFFLHYPIKGTIFEKKKS